MFNFDVPNHAEDYVHRIGRTGRAGKSGRAYHRRKRGHLKHVTFIETLIGKPIPLVKIIEGRVIDADTNKGVNKAKLDKRSKNSELFDQDQMSPIDKAADRKLAKVGNKKPVKGKSKPAEKTKKINRGDELPSPPDCSGNTFAETGHVPAFLSR